jgi:hypothetical protein
MLYSLTTAYSCLLLDKAFPVALSTIRQTSPLQPLPAAVERLEATGSECTPSGWFVYFVSTFCISVENKHINRCKIGV